MARITGPRKVDQYTDEFKLKTVKLTEVEGMQVQQIATAFEIHPWMLMRRRKGRRAGRCPACRVCPAWRRMDNEYRA